ncbi:HNH endonuclease signature motif containing protein [Microbacterium gilvum]|uniref:HNH nuclease domain-containing protein n=1 Tax=Microbacterium gilvum TaxID=1336204 RepID=A0ABP9AQ40_9MICO
MLLVAQLVQIANAQHDRERRAAAPGEEDRGWAYRSLAEEIAGVLGCSRRTAQARMGDAVQLVNDYPETLARMQAGEVTGAQARVILRHGETLDQDARGMYEGRVLARLAEASMNTARLAAACEKIAEDLHPVPLSERFATAHARRRVVFECDRDGMGWLHAYLPALVGHAALERIRALASELKTADTDHTATATAPAAPAAASGAAFGIASPAHAPAAPHAAAAMHESDARAAPDAPDARTAAQRQADVLADLLLAGAPTAGPDGVPTGLSSIRAHVQITIPARPLLDTVAARHNADAGTDTLPDLGTPSAATGLAAASADDPSPARAPASPRGAPPEPSSPDGAWLCGHGAIPIVQALDLTANAPGWERLFHDADTGALLTVDHRLPTTAQRRYLTARDEHCRFPGCRTPIRTRTTDADHTRDHRHGGPTCICNLAYLCESHHTLKHHSAWTVRQKPGGVLQWTSPTGRTYTDIPAPAIRFTPDGDPPPF